ncbi:hypothetical protein O181_043900 [Austropuccinia psidii MF-1]|uniref:Uncharacterized protein n=1 Tax=Austropuccinia psidii MF-1 TaxID=1389203 RepID=A0A9Q3DNH2_9BASI|nr:hypothetical protein [Austropuccinia psidii MF-1]
MPIVHQGISKPYSTMILSDHRPSFPQSSCQSTGRLWAGLPDGIVNMHTQAAPASSSWASCCAPLPGDFPNSHLQKSHQHLHLRKFLSSNLLCCFCQFVTPPRNAQSTSYILPTNPAIRNRKILGVAVVIGGLKSLNQTRFKGS